MRPGHAAGDAAGLGAREGSVRARDRRRGARRATPGTVAIGERFGELIVEGELPTLGRCRRWLCRCDCGAQAIRTTSALRRTLVRGSTSCRTCLEELRRGRSIARREAFTDHLRACWAEIGTLWSHRAEERLCDEIRDALDAEFGPAVETVRPRDLWVDPTFREHPTERQKRDAAGHDDAGELEELALRGAAALARRSRENVAVQDWLRRVAGASP